MELSSNYDRIMALDWIQEHEPECMLWHQHGDQRILVVQSKKLGHVMAGCNITAEAPCVEWGSGWLGGHVTVQPDFQSLGNALVHMAKQSEPFEVGIETASSLWLPPLADGSRACHIVALRFAWLAPQKDGSRASHCLEVRRPNCNSLRYANYAEIRLRMPLRSAARWEATIERRVESDGSFAGEWKLGDARDLAYVEEHELLLPDVPNILELAFALGLDLRERCYLPHETEVWVPQEEGNV